MSLTPEDLETLTEQVTHELAARKSHWAAMIQRRQDIASLIANRWQNVWPDELESNELPAVANIFRTTTEDLGRLFAEQLPTERVYSSGPDDDDDAERREQVIMGYTSASQLNDYLEYIGMDMVAAGYSALKTWPDFSRPRDSRIPTFRRLHPMTTLPEMSWSPDKPTNHMIVYYAESLDRLKRTAPAAAQALLDRVGESAVERMRGNLAYKGQPGIVQQPTLEMVDWYADNAVARVACWTDPLYPDERYGVLVEAVENRAGLCPVQLAPRPTWALEPIGQLDDSKGTILTKNRYFSILIDYFIRMVYGGKLAWNVRNPTEIGPDTTYLALGPDAKMESVTPQVPSFQAMTVIEMLDSEGRSGATAPASREGEVDLNKASAAFLSKAQGQYSSVVRSLQRNHAIAKRRANEVAIELDKVMCNWPKKLTGEARGKRFAISYTPRELFGDDRSNQVTYGTSSGLDGPTHNVINLQKRQTGNMSLESYLEQDPSTEDVEMELARLAEDAIRGSLLQGLMGMDPNARIRAYHAFKQRRSVDDVVEELMKQPPAPGMEIGAAGTPQVPALAPSGAAGAEAPAAATPLPPLSALRQVGPPGRPAPVPARR